MSEGHEDDRQKKLGNSAGDEGFICAYNDLSPMDIYLFFKKVEFDRGSPCGKSFIIIL